MKVLWLNKRKCVLGKPISLFSLFSTSSLRFLVSSRAISSGQDIKVSRNSEKRWRHTGITNVLKMNWKMGYSTGQTRNLSCPEQFMPQFPSLPPTCSGFFEFFNRLLQLLHLKMQHTRLHHAYFWCAQTTCWVFTIEVMKYNYVHFKQRQSFVTCLL